MRVHKIGEKKYMKKWKVIFCSLLCAIGLCSCDFFKPKIYTYTTTTTETVTAPERVVTYRFVDDYQNQYEIAANPNVPSCIYNKAAYLLNGNRMSYGESAFGYRFGIDVSYYQKGIDWQRVKADGVEFAMIRLGYRGYSDGALYLDDRFLENIQSAQGAGIDVGVYFFAQAVNEAEAKEEAEYVIKQLEGYSIQMPIAYDLEDIDDDTGRMDNISVSQRSRNAAVFCQTIKDAGYEAMIYCNMYYEAYKLDLELLSGFPIWYADYNRYPQTPYHFAIWQYSNKGKVDGIDGYVDLNIQMMSK